MGAIAWHKTDWRRAAAMMIGMRVASVPHADVSASSAFFRS